MAQPPTSRLSVVGDTYEIFRLDGVPGAEHLPFALKVLLENVLRHHLDPTALTGWDPGASDTGTEIAFAPARILLQDFTGVPALVDLAALRDAVAERGGDASKVDPLVPVDLVIDHSVVADTYGRPDSFARNTELEMARNLERYRFLRWGQAALHNFRVVPPGTGICHQVNLEYLASVVLTRDGVAFPDTVIGTDSHTTMVNGLGVLGWGVGGIEAEAAMLGLPIPMAVPPVVGFELTGTLPAGSTATDLVLVVTELLRAHGVVGKFVEFHGEGMGCLPVADRATIANMSPEYGSTCALFPVDAETLRYLTFTGRPPELVALVEAYAKEQGLWHEPSQPARYSEHLSLDLGTVVASLAGPSRPQDRVPLHRAQASFHEALGRPPRSAPASLLTADGGRADIPLSDGAVVIAAVTSCTNTSNPAVMVAAGLLARNAVEAGLQSQPWVKTSLAPGSRVVMDYLDRAGLTPYLDKLGFELVGFGCTTCIGNSGPLPTEVSAAIAEGGLSAVAVLSGNRNFEGRIHPEVRMNYLASPPLVIAYALAGTMDIDLTTEPLGHRPSGEPVLLAQLWPSPQEVAATISSSLDAEMFLRAYSGLFAGDSRWRAIEAPTSFAYQWDESSTYVRRPPYISAGPLSGHPGHPGHPGDAGHTDIRGARALLVLGDSVTTDHISPAGSIPLNSPAGRWLTEAGVLPGDLSSYGARRGNHEVMVRGTFANLRLRNRLAPGTEGGVTRHLPDGDPGSVYDVAMRYEDEGVPLVVLAGREYGTGSSRDWAAKGVALLGVRAVLAESFERIHRSNLVGMGVLPLQFPPGQTFASLGLTGGEVFDITGLEGTPTLPKTVSVRAADITFEAVLRVEGPTEEAYLQAGGVLPYALAQLSPLT